jgi:CCR4-Not complex component, Not1.
MRLPDPFTPNLKVDMLPEIAHAPRVLTNFASMIQPMSFKKVLSNLVMRYSCKSLVRDFILSLLAFLMSLFQPFVACSNK